MATCTLIQTSGFPCGNDPDPDSFYRICAYHWAEIIEDHKRLVAGGESLAEVKCPVCKHVLLTGPGVPVTCPNPHCWEDAWWRLPSADEGVPTRAGTDWVYYIQFGDRIKIGTTTNVKRRLSVLPYDSLLALEPGGLDLERARLRAFEGQRIPTQREWFNDHDELRSHIAEIVAEHGDPLALLGKVGA